MEGTGGDAKIDGVNARFRHIAPQGSSGARRINDALAQHTTHMIGLGWYTDLLYKT